VVYIGVLTLEHERSLFCDQCREFIFKLQRKDFATFVILLLVFVSRVNFLVLFVNKVFKHIFILILLNLCYFLNL